MDFKEFYSQASPWLNSNYFDSELRNILVTFTRSRNWTLVNSEQEEAPALIRPQSNYIAFNPVLIAASLFELRHELKLVDSRDEFVKKFNYVFSNIAKCIKTFLLLHEIGHWLYSASPKDFVPLMKQYCSEFPPELTMYLLNVVEDSVIQRLFMLDYRGSFYRQCFDIGICCFQGAEAVKSYVAKSEQANWSIKTKLFYFIIRAYNLYDSEVQAMFNIPDKIGWKEDTIEAFDQAITTIDKNDRAKYVCEVLAPLVFRDLVEEIDATDGTEATDADDLLEQDKLYKSKNAQNKPNSSQSSSSSSNQSTTDEGSDGNSTEEDTEDDGTEGEGTSESDDADTNSDKDEGDSDGDSSGNSSEQDEDGESKQSPSNSNSEESSTEPASEVTPTAPEEKTIQEKIAEACKELNKSINAQSEPEKVSEAPRLKEQSNPLAVSCGVIDHTANKFSNNFTSTMNSLTLNIYGNAIGILDKIFTMNNDVIRGLDQGELDEDELYTYYTEKNLNIYKEEHKVKQDKKVVVYFILDNSGSMSGHRYDYSSAAFIGLIHAFEDIQIKCCFLSFGEDVRLIKKFEDSTSFLGVESPLQYMVDEHVSDLEGDTNLFPALDYVINDATFNDNDPDLCKVVIVATDGCTSKESACAYVAEQISSEALMFAVGLDMGGHLEYLQRVMPGAIVKNYDGSNIATQLPEDIYEEIINRFLLY